MMPPPAGAAARSRRLVLLRRGLGLAAGIALVVVLVLRMPWREAFAVLAQARIGWWLAGVGVGGLGIFLRSIRLHTVLGAETGAGDPVGVTGVWRALAFGYLGGLVLPAGGGELVKIRVLMRARGLGVLHAGSAVAVDRLLDLLGLTAALTILSQLQALPGSAGRALRLLGWLLLAVGGILALLLAKGEALLPEGPAGEAGQGWKGSVLASLRNLLASARHLREAGVWGRLLALQGLALGLDALAASLVLRALPLSGQLPGWAGLQLTAFSMLGFALPLLPGAVGSIQVACILALRPFGVPTHEALAFSLLSHLGHVVVVLLNGAGAYVGSRARKG